MKRKRIENHNKEFLVTHTHEEYEDKNENQYSKSKKKKKIKSNANNIINNITKEKENELKNNLSKCIKYYQSIVGITTNTLVTYIKAFFLLELSYFHESLIYYHILLNDHHINSKSDESESGILYELVINEMCEVIKDKNKEEIIENMWKVVKDISSEMGNVKNEKKFKGFIYSNVGRCWLGLKKYEKSIEYMNKGIELGGDNKTLSWTVYCNRGSVYFQLKQFDKALNDFTTGLEILLSLDSKNKIDTIVSEVYYSRACALLEVKKYEEAIFDLNKAIEVSNNANYYTLRGDCYFEMEKFDKSIDDYSKAIEIKPKDPDSLTKRGHCYYIKNCYELSIKDLTMAIEIRPLDYSFNLYINRGFCYYNSGKYDLSLSDCNNAISLKTDHDDAYFLKSLCHLRNENYDKSLLNINKAIEINPKCFIYYQSKGNILVKLNKIIDAIYYYTKSREYCTCENARRNLSNKREYAYGEMKYNDICGFKSNYFMNSKQFDIFQF